ncbi:Golgi apparatus protein 1-like [Homarus americanus]|uniref:Golgi apparatus protein 1-like n=1 Tax=Homarus americanus TaxID=6706 RepID=A0A8J5KFI0_HOMAM|nr:Golgi apparatus protein 1-like [Homarus americanus]
MKWLVGAGVWLVLLYGCAVADTRVDQPAALPQPKKSTVVKLVDEEDCREDIRRLCKDDVRNNFARDLQEVINDKCNHLLWNYKMNLTRSGRIEELAKDVCETELKHFHECEADSSPGHIISCMTDRMDQIKDERCHQYILRLAAIVFSDFHYVKNMVNDCRGDIENFKCGRVDPAREGQPHSQGSTIECLTKHATNLDSSCHKQILRLSELQSDDFHLDRALFFACREDREKFCGNIRSGEGRVYKCLMKHKTERGMSKECVDQISRRQQLTVQDYRVNRGIVRACRSAITENSCRKGTSDSIVEVKLSKILLCLEEALQKGVTIDGACKDEMLAHRQQLMEDFKLSPELMSQCKVEITKFCNDGIETGGRTLHCLMKHIRSRNSRSQVSVECRNELEAVIKASDAGEDWRVDPVLHEACLPMVESTCKDVRGGNARVMRCLMRHIDSSEMPQACEAALLEIQYFVSRDWKLDPQLHMACVNDAIKLCNAKKDWAASTQNTNVQRGVQVLPCLFRYVYHPKPHLRLSSNCMQEVQRVMHERAAYVDLHPEIEMVCMEQLAHFCSEHTGPGEEIACLQDNLEQITREDCKNAVGNYTEAEAKDTRLNSQLTVQCAAAIPEMCKGEAQPGSEDGALMDCLIRHKHAEKMKHYPKCRAVIEHFQLISMKDYTFSPRFKESCQGDVASLCRPKPKNKADVIDCLSTLVRNDIINDNDHQVTKLCRQQLRQQLVQRHENAKLDPRLQQKCREDINKFCKDVTYGRGVILECLRSHKRELEKPCHELLFAREQEEQQDPSTDVVLVTSCKQMITQYCHDVNPEKLLYCLKANKEEPNFDGHCRTIVIRRMVEQTTDARLNPDLLRACRRDMAKFCFSLFEREKTSSTELNGLLTECLKEQLPGRKLSSTCKIQILSVARTAALNYKMDPILLDKCKTDMSVLCREFLTDDSGGHMLECLKLSFDHNKIKSDECRLHVAHIIETQRADIHVDPVLNEACGIDDNKYCDDIENGHHLACLLDVLERNPNGLKTECREKLRERREMFNAALKLTNVRSIGDLVGHVSNSPERNYFLLVMITTVGIIFVGGLFCGRATKRYKLLKDR